MGLTKMASGVGLALAVVLAVGSWQQYVGRVADAEMGEVTAAVRNAAGRPVIVGIRVEVTDENGCGAITVEPRTRLSEVLALGGVALTGEGLLSVQCREGNGWRHWMFSMEGLRRGEVEDVLMRTGDKVQLDPRDLAASGAYAVGGDRVERPGGRMAAEGMSVGDVLVEAGCDLERMRGRWVVVRRATSRGGNVNVAMDALLEGERVEVKAGDFVEVLSAGRVPLG